MMETATEKKKGNPNFGKKESQPKEKLYILTVEQHQAKPVNKETGISDHAPFPPTRFFSTEGVANDPKTGERRRWRYVYGWPSIWLDDQEKPKPSKQELESPKNEILFTHGRLRVDTADRAKIMALEVQDEFEGNKNKVREVPVEYRLVNPNEQLEQMFESADKSYEAQKAARESNIEDMLAIASVLGIDVSGGEDNEVVIRKAFILKAIQNPTIFLREFVNPRNKIKYLVSKALMNNIISSTMIEGKLVYTDSGAVILDVNPAGDISEQVAVMVLGRNEKAISLYEQLKLTAE